MCHVEHQRFTDRPRLPWQKDPCRHCPLLCLYAGEEANGWIQGYRYTVALPDLHLEKISVKIDGNQLIEKADGYPEVEFNGFEMRAYQDDKKNVLFTAKAESVVLVNPGKKPS